MLEARLWQQEVGPVRKKQAAADASKESGSAKPQSNGRGEAAPLGSAAQAGGDALESKDQPDLVAMALQHAQEQAQHQDASASALVSLGVSPGPWVAFQALSPPVVLPMLPAATQQHGGATQAAAAEWVHGGEGPAPPSKAGVAVPSPGELPQHQAAIEASGTGVEDDVEGQNAVELLTQSQATHVPIVAPRCGKPSPGALVVSLGTAQLQTVLRAGELRLPSGPDAGKQAAGNVLETIGQAHQLAGLPLLLADSDRGAVLGLFALAGRAQIEGSGASRRVRVQFLCVAECPPLPLAMAQKAAGGAPLLPADASAGGGGSRSMAGSVLPPDAARSLAISMLSQWPVPMAMALVLVLRQAKLAWRRARLGEGEQVVAAPASAPGEGEEASSSAGAQAGTSSPSLAPKGAKPHPEDEGGAEEPATTGTVD